MRVMGVAAGSRSGKPARGKWIAAALVVLAAALPAPAQFAKRAARNGVAGRKATVLIGAQAARLKLRTISARPSASFADSIASRRSLKADSRPA